MFAGVADARGRPVVVLRYIARGGRSRHRSVVLLPGPLRSLHGFGLTRPSCSASCWSSGCVGGWLLAGRMLAPLARITDATRVAGEWIALAPHPVGRPQRRVPRARRRLRRHARPPRSARRRTAAVRRQCLARTTHPAGDHADPARGGPARSERDPGELLDRLHAVNARAIDLTEALLAAQPRRPAVLHPEPVDLSLIAEEATETLLPLAERRGVDYRDPGDIGVDQRLARAPAADVYEPGA